jgi:hypothetical protein
VFFRRSKQRPPPYVKEFVARVREDRAGAGHPLTLMQEAIATSIAECDPNFVSWSHEKLAVIAEAVEQKGEWVEWDEWRISTAFDVRIAKTKKTGEDWYEATVECDGQRLACLCPTLKKAFAFVQLYKRLIIDQFYSVGPPWAANHLYEVWDEAGARTK